MNKNLAHVGPTLARRRPDVGTNVVADGFPSAAKPLWPMQQRAVYDKHGKLHVQFDIEPTICRRRPDIELRRMADGGQRRLAGGVLTTQRHIPYAQTTPTPHKHQQGRCKAYASLIDENGLPYTRVDTRKHA